jgi:beta-lactamase superfamily II metal-dependent hydrolase
MENLKKSELFNMLCAAVMNSTLACLMAFVTHPVAAQQQLKPWKTGYLDIHQIATGRGNAAFAMLPDGTTMLIDAGDLGKRVGRNGTIMPALPNDQKLPAEWISRYIKHFNKSSKNKHVDYVLLTHFHNDHMGGVSEKALKVPGRKYLLSGITQLAELTSIKRIIDRGYPEYSYPSKVAVEKTTTDFGNYLRFIDHQKSHRKIIFERFIPGSNTQFQLQYAPKKYSEFSIRNIYSNGELWTGIADNSRSIFPKIEELDEADFPNENMLSNVIKLSYGKFSYYSGGDVTGVISSGKPMWRDVESQLASVVGKIDVAVLNHHGYTDAMNSTFVKALHASAFVIPVWDFYHPQPETLGRLIDSSIYSQIPDIYATGLVASNRERLGDAAKHIKTPGHVVVRVYPGGNTYQIFVLEAHSEQYEVLYESKMYQSNSVQNET